MEHPISTFLTSMVIITFLGWLLGRTSWIPKLVKIGIFLFFLYPLTQLPNPHSQLMYALVAVAFIGGALWGARAKNRPKKGSQRLGKQSQKVAQSEQIFREKAAAEEELRRQQREAEEHLRREQAKAEEYIKREWERREREYQQRQKQQSSQHSQHAQKSEESCPYKVLGVSKAATQAEIRKAYKTLMSRYHPDKAATATEEIKALATEKVKEIQAAYESFM